MQAFLESSSAASHEPCLAGQEILLPAMDMESLNKAVCGQIPESRAEQASLRESPFAKFETQAPSRECQRILLLEVIAERQGQEL